MGDTLPIQILTLLFGIMGLVIINVVLKNIKKDFFIYTMLNTFGALLLTRIFFSLLYIIDYSDGTLFNNRFYNWFAGFIGLQTVVSVIFIGVLSLNRMGLLDKNKQKIKQSFYRIFNRQNHE